MTGKPRELNLRQQKFVQEYMANGGNGAAAARAAGYPANDASTTAWKLIHTSKAVKAEIDRARQELTNRTDYGAEKAMNELGEVIEFARETKNATAMARAVELRMRMAGLLVEKAEINVQGTVDVVGALLEGRQRAGLLEYDDEDEPIDGEFTEVDPQDEPASVDIFS